MNASSTRSLHCLEYYILFQASKGKRGRTGKNQKGKEETS